MEALIESGCKEHVPSVLVVGTAVAFFAFLDLILRQVQINQKNVSSRRFSDLSTLVCSEQTKVTASINSNHAAKDLQLIDHNNDQRQWKLRNIILSWIHSIISGPLAILCVVQHPVMIDDVIATCSPLSLALVCFSLGYFIHDSIHMLRHKLSAETLELLLHHALIFITYGIAVATRAFVAYAVVSLFMEVNSVWLHARQLANMFRVAKDSYGYRFLSVTNVGTFIVFRFVTTVWMSRWLFDNWGTVPIAMALLGSVGLLIISVMNCVLLLRLVNSDFFYSSSTSSHSSSNVPYLTNGSNGSSSRQKLPEQGDKDKDKDS